MPDRADMAPLRYLAGEVLTVSNAEKKVTETVMYVGGATTGRRLDIVKTLFIVRTAAIWHSDERVDGTPSATGANGEIYEDAGSRFWIKGWDSILNWNSIRDGAVDAVVQVRHYGRGEIT